MQMLSADVTLWADGGGKARGAALHPLRGREAVARFVLASIKFLPDGAVTQLSEVNGELSFILRSGTQVFVVLSIGVDQGYISEIRAIGNPDKLKWISEAHSTNDTSDTNEATQ